MHYALTTLPNGLRVITEAIPGLRSVAVGCWVDTGTRDELPNEAGASHFLEHLLFKGSETLTARQISETFDAMGAESNAFTTKEYTCFWARLLDQDLPKGLGVLAEMLLRPAFRPDEIDSERQVVIEEINMNDDDPSDVAFEEFTTALFDGHPLERPVLGTRESIRAMTRDDLHGYWQRRYRVGSAVLALTGSIEHGDVVELAGSLFGSWEGPDVDHELAEPLVEHRVRVVRRPTEQTHLVIGGEGLTRSDERRFALEVMNHVLGGGLSSRLFTTIREERGLAYSIYSFRLPFADTGAWGVYIGTTPDLVGTAMELILSELELMSAKGVSQDELDRAKGNMRGGLAISLEDANSRMTRLGRDELIGNPHLSVDERIERIESVTLEEVREVAAVVLGGPRVIGAVGPFDPSDLEQYVA
jgi:predicted Zn-dependent peptidase